MTAEYGRVFVVDRFRDILTGWHRCLRETSASCAVWEHADGIHTKNFVSASGKQVDGVTRMLPALAAWVCQHENPAEMTLGDGTVIRPLQILRDALVHGTDPRHADFWQYAPNDQNQRQVEASVVAWAIWVARRELLPMLSAGEIANLQAWLESCTQYTDLFSNWTLFVAVNHAARVSLSSHGFRGDVEVIRQRLVVSDEADVGDGWMWDSRYTGLDYYNFWVNASHHLYIRAMLPELRDERLTRAVERSKQRLADLPHLIDARGQNVLFGRSLAYRWGWLSGLMAAVLTGDSPISGGLARTMLARNLECYQNGGAFNERGVLRERLTAAGSDGSRQGYINCSHPYWGMQAFVCLALPAKHAFWTEAAGEFPVTRGDFQVARQGPGMIFQGLRESGEVRVFNARNLNHGGNALYEKFVYSSAFPCNALAGQVTCWDNQLGMRLADGTHVGPGEVLLVDVLDPQGLRVVTRYRLGEFQAIVTTLIQISGEAYTTRHAIRYYGTAPAGAQWIEGGFALGRDLKQAVTVECDGSRASAECLAAGKRVVTETLEGWQTLHDLAASKALYPPTENPNIFHETADHFLLTSPVGGGNSQLNARHSANFTKKH